MKLHRIERPAVDIEMSKALDEAVRELQAARLRVTLEFAGQMTESGAGEVVAAALEFPGSHIYTFSTGRRMRVRDVWHAKDSGIQLHTHGGPQYAAHIVAEEIPPAT